jgi:hypothetical protein
MEGMQAPPARPSGPSHARAPIQSGRITWDWKDRNVWDVETAKPSQRLGEHLSLEATLGRDIDVLKVASATRSSPCARGGHAICRRFQDFTHHCVRDLSSARGDLDQDLLPRETMPHEHGPTVNVSDDMSTVGYGTKRHLLHNRKPRRTGRRVRF